MNLDNINKYYESVINKATAHGIDGKYMDILLSTLFYRGARKNLDDTLYYIEVLQNEDKEAANMFLLNDKNSGSVSDDTYVYSGTGKEFGLQKIATMAYYLPNDVIGKFREVRLEFGKKKAESWLDAYCFEHHGKILSELVKTMRK